MRILTGHFKGRVIPSHRSLANIRLTSARLKESLFSMLGADLSGLRFLDLCAGSGQIGLEACSRGACVVLNEPDRRRYAQLCHLLQEWGAAAVEVRADKAQVLIPQLEGQKRHFDLVYVDPPYRATRRTRPLSLELLEQLGQSELLVAGGLALVQHQAELKFPAQVGRLVLLQRRPYGNTALSIYRRTA